MQSNAARAFRSTTKKSGTAERGLTAGSVAPWVALLLFMSSAFLSCGTTRQGPRRITSSPADQSILAIAAIRDLARAGRLEAARRQAKELRISIPQTETARLTEIMLLESELSTTKESSSALEKEFLELAAIHESNQLAALCLALAARLPSTDPENKINRTQRALEIDGNCSIAHMTRAETFDLTQQRTAALESWEKAASGANAPSLALSGYANALARRGRDRQAVVIYRRLTGQNPDDFAAAYNLGTLLLTRLNASAEAHDWLTVALKKSPADYDVIFNLAVASLRTDRIEEAQGLLDQAKRIRPSDPEVHFNMALLHADHRNDPAAAVQCFRTYLALGGDEKLRVNRWIKELSSGESSSLQPAKEPIR